jgi:hypothetical protein
MSEIDRLASWSDHDTLANLLDMEDGPFGSFGTVEYFGRDGKSWVRVKSVTNGELIDIEIRPDGYMGEIREGVAEGAGSHLR